MPSLLSILHYDSSLTFTEKQGNNILREKAGVEMEAEIKRKMSSLRESDKRDLKIGEAIYTGAYKLSCKSNNHLYLQKCDNHTFRSYTRCNSELTEEA